MTTTQTTAKLNTMAILAFVFVFIASPLAVIFGGVALSQIGRSGERGRALAIWAIVLGLINLLTSLGRVAFAGVFGWDLGGSAAVLNWIW